MDGGKAVSKMRVLSTRAGLDIRSSAIARASSSGCLFVPPCCLMMETMTVEEIGTDKEEPGVP